MNTNPITIIAIDGTSSSGKGTVASRLAHELGFHYLNSGALYRLSAHLAIVHGIDISDKHESNLNKVVDLITAEADNVTFVDKQVLYKGQDIWPLLSSQEMGNAAALIGPYPPLREAIKEFQRKKIQSPGLVAEGRDMGTDVFPDALVKIYLDATVEARAMRRFKEEEARGSGKTYEMICEELEKRDYADKNRPVGALRKADDALYIDTSLLTREETFAKALAWCKEFGIEK
jgi:cytidylate kinase